VGDKLTPDQVAERLHITRDHLNQLNFRGDGPPRIKISTRRFLYDSDRLEEWMSSREQAGSTKVAVA